MAVLVEEQQLATKKRAVLGDVTNLASAVALANSILGVAPQKPKPKLETNKNVTAARDEEDPQLCGPYAADIYAYLRRMEVNIFPLLVSIICLFDN